MVKNKIIQKVIFAVEAVISLCFLPLMKIKWFCDEAVLPGQNVDTSEVVAVKRYYYYSTIDNLKEYAEWLPYALTVVFVVCACVSVAAIIKTEKKCVKIAAHSAFGISAFAFLVAVFLASAVARGY